MYSLYSILLHWPHFLSENKAFSLAGKFGAETVSSPVLATHRSRDLLAGVITLKFVTPHTDIVTSQVAGVRVHCLVVGRQALAEEGLVSQLASSEKIQFLVFTFVGCFHLLAETIF